MPTTGPNRWVYKKQHRKLWGANEKWKFKLKKKKKKEVWITTKEFKKVWNKKSLFFLQQHNLQLTCA